MKKSLLVTTLLIFSAWTVAAPKSPDLKNNFCRPIVDSKRYLTNNFEMKYPKKVKFECTYECMVNNRISNVNAVSEVTVTSMADDASSVVCQGVRVKKVSWGYDFDGVDLFYAYDGSMNELKQFAFDNIVIKNSSPEEVERLTKLKADLNQVAAAYVQAGVSSGAQGFKDAGKILSDIASQLPQKTTLLDSAIKQLIIKKGVIPYDAKAETLVDRVILSSARWRVPTHQF